MVRIEGGDPGMVGGIPSAGQPVRVGLLGLDGILRVPPQPRALVLFAHGSGSSRHSPRNARVADALGRRGMATLLFDLLLPSEGEDRARVFDIPLLAGRLVDAVRWIDAETALRGLPLGLFGASTGAAAALVAARRLGPRIAAVVSRGGRPDLADAALAAVTAPTLLIVGARDAGVIELNQAALGRLGGEKALVLIPGATHLFEEPGTLDAAVAQAVRWFERHLPERTEGEPP